MGLKTSIRLTGGFIKSLPTGGTAPARFKGPGMPSGLIRLFDGIGLTQCNVAWVLPWEIETTDDLDVDLTTGLTDLSEAPIVMSALKLLICVVDAPGDTDYVQLGPQGATNANPLWFADVTADFYNKVYGTFINALENNAGWSVGGSTKIVRINNPTAGTLSGWLIGAGIQDP